MNTLIVLLSAVASLLSNPKVQSNPSLLAEAQSISSAANQIAEEYTAVHAETPASSLYTPIETQPILGSASVPVAVHVPPPPTPPLTTAWIEVNGQTGTIILASGTYGADITWGSSNALPEPNGCTIGLPQSGGVLGNSGESTKGVFQHPTNTVSILCKGQYNNASSSVVIITQ